MKRGLKYIVCEGMIDDVSRDEAVCFDADDSRADGGMKDYLAVHGWHFSKVLCDYAVSRMKGKAVFSPATKEHVDAVLRQNGVVLTSNVGHDATYVYNMAKSDFFGSSIPNEQFLALFVRDYIDDVDGYEGVALRRFVADCEGKGVCLDWASLV